VLNHRLETALAVHPNTQNATRFQIFKLTKPLYQTAPMTAALLIASTPYLLSFDYTSNGINFASIKLQNCNARP